ncbi:MAG: hypothetical protein U9N59_08855 [Campylobacterota bacterium]|nr:hypothetical protein [Campylobacterota bacterium]
MNVKLKMSAFPYEDKSNIEADDDSNNLGFKYGIDNNVARAYIDLSTLYSKDNDSYKSLSLNFDYHILKYKALKPFIGASIGLGQLKVENVGSDIGMDFGTKAGIKIDILKNVNFEVGYKYIFGIEPSDYSSGILALIESAHPNKTINGVNYNFSFDNIAVTYFSLNYKF